MADSELSQELPARPRVASTQSGYDPYKFFGGEAPAAITQQQEQPVQPAAPIVQTAPPAPVVQAPLEELDANNRKSVDDVALDKDMYPRTQTAPKTAPLPPSAVTAVEKPLPPSHDVDRNAVRQTEGPIDGLQVHKDRNAKPATGQKVDPKGVPGLAVNEGRSSQPSQSHDAPQRTEKQQPSAQISKSSNEDSQGDAGRYPNPDLVLIFRLPKPDAPREEWQDAEQEYNKLKRSMKQAGLLAIAKPGAKGRNERLILVRAVQSVVRAEAQNEKLTDWLNTLKGSASRDNPHLPRDFNEKPFYPAERARHAATVLERALVDHSTLNPYPRLKAYFPPHDPAFNSRWLTQWSSLALQIPEDQLLAVRYHFGDAVAMYFEFLRFYFLALAIPAFFGLTSWMGGFYFSRLYSFILVIWSVLFVEAWKLRERQLSVQWGTYGLSKQARVRVGWKPEATITSAVTGEKVPHAPWYHRELRTAASIPVVFAFAGVLGLVISFIFATEVVVNEVYGGPGKSLLSFLPIGLFATVVPQVVDLWYNVAKQLTIWENHPTESDHQRSLTLKMFVLNGIVSFGALTLTSYVYLPFGAFVVPKIVHLLRRSVSEQTVSRGAFDAPAGFAASSARLTGTLAALMTTTQFLGFLQETLIPWVQRKIADYQNGGTASASSSGQGKKTSDGKTVQRATTTKGQKGEDNWLERLRAESELQEYSLFSDYAEMAVQFGHVVLFSTAWPLAPVAAFINNFVEIRGDAFKLAVNSRRPVPQRVDSIGAWAEAIGWISYLGALTNASLVYLLRPYTREHPHSTAIEPYVGQSAAPNSTAEKLLATAASSSPVNYTITRIEAAQADFGNVKSLLLGALLCALASEHGYRLLRKLVSHVAEKMLWDGSAEDIELKQKSWTLRKDWAESQGGRDFEKEIERLKGRKEEDLNNVADELWREEDRGIREESVKKNQ